MVALDRMAPGDALVGLRGIVVTDEDGVVGPRVRANRVMAALIEVQAKEEILDAQVVRREITTLWDRSRHLVHGVGEL